MAVRYDENSITTLDYREAARQSIGMYIGGNSAENMQHLVTEIVSNAMDEAAEGYGKLIQVIVNTNDNSVEVIDQGRGIPYKKNKAGKFAIVEMCTSLHSGGKFEGQGNYKSSLGLNGVGATITNALSTTFIINVWRDGEHCTFSVLDGKHGDPVVEKYSGKNQGSSVYFIPDAKVFNNAKWDIEKIREELQLHALLNNGITFELIVNTDGKKVQDIKYLYKSGLKDLLLIKSEGKKMLTDITYFKTTTEHDSENVSADVEIAFAYTDEPGERIYSFVNGGYTPNDGTHVTGFKTAFTSLMNKMGKELGYLKDDKKFSGDSVRRGLVLCLSIKMTQRPMFAEQTKKTLNSPCARQLVSKAVGKMQIENNVIKQILKKIENEQKAEEAAQRKREAQEKIAKGGHSMNSLRDLPEKLADASDFTNAEIFFCEGDSAAGGAKTVKAKNQAIMPLRGKILNTTCKELADIIKSDVIKDILTCLGCGIGDNFNIKNLRYDKLIIMTDADSDGKHIELLLMTLFLHHLPELVKQGKVYVTTPPLFKTTTSRGEIKYWYEENSEFKKYIKSHSNLDIIRYKGLGEQDAKELYATTMDPANRKLVQLTTNDIEKTLELYSKLMGKSAAERRNYIISHNMLAYDAADDDFEDLDDFDEE